MKLHPLPQAMGWLSQSLGLAQARGDISAWALGMPDHHTVRVTVERDGIFYHRHETPHGLTHLNDPQRYAEELVARMVHKLNQACGKS